MHRFATFASRGVRGAWLETIIMPSNFKKLVRARRAKTGEGHQTAARHVRADATAGMGPEAPNQAVPGDGRPTQLKALATMSSVMGIDSRDATSEAYDLLTDIQKRTLCDWIRANFMPAKTIYQCTSYSMKQPFTGDGRGPFYVTNEQFKGAMRAAGFEPLDPTVEKWRFRVARKINDPKSGSFLEWILARKTRHGPLGNLARDAADDRHFPPGELTKDALLGYLRHRNACSEALDAADLAWCTFTSSTKSAMTETENEPDIEDDGDRPKAGPATVFACMPRSHPKREPVCAVTYVSGRPTAKSPFGREGVSTMCGHWLVTDAVDYVSLTDVAGNVTCPKCKEMLDNGGFDPGPGGGMCAYCDRYPYEGHSLKCSCVTVYGMSSNPRV